MQDAATEFPRTLASYPSMPGASLLDVQLPDTLLSTPRCDPRDGWSGGRNHHRYANYSNALPPACVPGSAQALQRLDIRWTGTNYITLKLKKGSLPPITGPIRMAIYRGTGPVNDCDGYVGVAACAPLGSRGAKCATTY